MLGALKDLTADLYRSLTNDETASVLDSVKDLGFHYATSSGITIAINDIQVSAKKPAILTEAAKMVDDYDEQFLSGLISEDERYAKTVEAWTWASDQTTVLVEEELPNYGGIAVMAVSGAKGNISQIKQMAGMRGLMSNPKGRIIETHPVPCVRPTNCVFGGPGRSTLYVTSAEGHLFKAETDMTGWALFP